MSASDDARPDSGEEIGTTDRNPSVDQILRVYRALDRFAINRDLQGDYVHEQEDEILPRFTDLADALRPIRSRLDRFEGWPDRVGRDFRRLCDLFDATARRWKWERFAAPEPERSALIEERRRWFGENRERPYYEAAISAEPAFDGTDDRWKIRAIADEGRKLGYGPTPTAARMTAAELRTLYLDAAEALKRRPYLSAVAPNLGDQCDEYVQAWSDLRAALRPHAPAAIDPSSSRPAAPPDPGTTPPPGGKPDAAGPDGSPREDRQAVGADASGSRDGRLDEPPRRAIDAYRAVRFAGEKQEKVAKRFGVSQGTISRWIGRVGKWIEAGNILPDLDAPRPKVVAMDPRKIEQGPRLR